MDKGVGFNRQLWRSWLDAAAAFVAESQDPATLRAQLEPVLTLDMAGVDARRKTIDLLLNIWLRTREEIPALWDFAMRWNQTTATPADRLWLHYGLTLAYYPFFRACVAAIGQLGRYGEPLTNRLLVQHVASEMGQLGSLERSTQRVMASLRDWGLVHEAETRFTYAPQAQTLVASHVDLEAWLLACALHAHPAEELPFADLTRLPELFPFRFGLDLDVLRHQPWFTVERQGAGWEMVRLTALNVGGYLTGMIVI